MKLKFSPIRCISIFLAISLVVTSCTKDGPVGATGPAGSAGSQGPAGANGTNGTNGTNGAPGTANIAYSNWLDVTYEPFYADSSAWIAEINAPRLVDSILNKGTIKVYLNLSSDSTSDQLIVSLPLTDILLTRMIINPFFSPQTITLLANTDASSFMTGAYHYFQYRYVIIPGGISAGRGAKTINWDDYKQVKAYLNLKD